MRRLTYIFVFFAFFGLAGVSDAQQQAYPEKINALSELARTRGVDALIDEIERAAHNYSQDEFGALLTWLRDQVFAGAGDSRIGAVYGILLSNTGPVNPTPAEKSALDSYHELGAAMMLASVLRFRVDAAKCTDSTGVQGNTTRLLSGFAQRALPYFKNSEQTKQDKIVEFAMNLEEKFHRSAVSNWICRGGIRALNDALQNGTALVPGDTTNRNFSVDVAQPGIVAEDIWLARRTQIRSAFAKEVKEGKISLSIPGK